MKKDTLPPDIKMLLPTVGLLLGLVLAFIIVGRVGLSQISSQSQKINAAKRDENALTQKETILKDVEANILPTADTSLLAVPDVNPALMAIAQVKELAFMQGLFVTNLRAGSPNGESGLGNVRVSLDTEGPPDQILGFVKSIKTVAPIIGVERLTLTGEGNLTVANISLVSYWAPLPVKISSLTEPLSGLTSEEQTLLDLLGSLTGPSFFETQPEEPAGRQDPFN